MTFRTFALTLSALLVPSLAFAQGTDPNRPRGAVQRAVDSLFARFANSTGPGCLVGADLHGARLLRSAYGMADIERAIPMRNGMVSEVGSVSKQFTAASLVLLEQDGKLSLDDPVAKYLPEFPDFRDAGGPITIRHLLQHTSGLREMYPMLELVGRPYGEVVHSNEEVLALMSGQRMLNFPVNSRYLYSNTNYALAALIVEQVSGQTMQAFMSARIFTPLGMPRATWRSDFRALVPNRVLSYAAAAQGEWEYALPFSNLHGSGGLLTTIDEVLRWTHALHTGRVGNGTTLATMARPAQLTDGSLTRYGLGLMVRDWRGVFEIAHSGSTAGYRSYVAYYPASGISVAMQCNGSNSDYVALGRSLAEVFLRGQLLPASVVRPVRPVRPLRPLPPLVATLDSATRASLDGVWWNDESGGSFTLTTTERGAVTRFSRTPPVTFTAITADSLVAANDRAIGIARDTSGHVTALRYHNGAALNIRMTRPVH